MKHNKIFYKVFSIFVIFLFLICVFLLMKDNLMFSPDEDVSIVEDSLDSGFLGVTGSNNKISDSNCESTLDKCTECPCKANVNCENYLFIKGEKISYLNKVEGKNLLKAICDKVKADANTNCLSESKLCSGKKAPANFICKGVAGVAGNPVSNYFESTGVVYDYDSSGKPKKNPDGTFVIKQNLKGLIIQCTSYCDVECNPEERS